MTLVPVRGEVTLWQDVRTTIGATGAEDLCGEALGGRTLGVHHSSDPGARVPHLKDVRRPSVAHARDIAA